MRRLIFILMIALLPLRGWMGEAMATEMAAMNIIATKATNTPATDDIHSKMSKSDCEMHQAKQVDVADDLTGDDTSNTASASCNLCQSCHATGLITSVQINSVNDALFAQPLAMSHKIASATLALSQKPPIS